MTLEEEHKAYNKAQRRASLPEISFNKFCKDRQRKKPNLKGVPRSLEAKTYIRPSPKVPSGDSMGTYATRKPEMVYNGERKLLGIGVMHKSNSVPIFSREDAEDIANMRRN